MSIVLYYTEVPSLVGTLILLGSAKGLCGLYLKQKDRPFILPASAVRNDEFFTTVVAQLQSYFAQELKQFSLPLDLEGTPFQVAVWQELARIPFGTVISYKELARRIGNPGAMRAVGSANGKNPISIIIPCHRVIAADGSWGGYGWGLPVKKQLLSLEGFIPQSKHSF